MKKLKQICIIVFCCCKVFPAWQLQGQTVKEATLATSVYLAENQPEKAYVLARRAYYFSDSLEQLAIEPLLAESAVQTGRMQEATVHYKRLLRVASDSTFDQLQLRYLQSLLNARLFEEAYKACDTSEMDNVVLQNQILFCKLLASVEVGQPAQTIELMDYLADSVFALPVSITLELKRKYNQLQRIHPSRVATYSLLIPGLGQASLKDYRNASNAFLLNGLLFTGFLITSHYHPILDSFLFWSNPFVHYYLGNARAASDLAEKKIQASRDEFYNELIHCFSGVK